MIKVVGIVLTALIINIVLKNYSKEFTFLINIVCTIIIFTLISKDLKGIVDRLTSISNEISVLLPYIKIMLKILGISMIAQLLSDLCRDNGENTLANQTELSAKIIILVTALPLFTTIIDIMIGMLK
jgi:stage III sporulation protein AD